MTAPLAKPPKLETRSVRIRRPREGDTGHVVTGIGHAFRCSCGATGRILPTYREAMQAGREHAAEHAEQRSEGATLRGAPKAGPTAQAVPEAVSGGATSGGAPLNVAAEHADEDAAA